LDAVDLLSAARVAGVDYIPGPSYFAAGGGRRNVRLAFSFLPPADLVEGVRRLMGVVAATTH
jgi:DNA-binding transcriptional MocR family regulator